MSKISRRAVVKLAGSVSLGSMIPVLGKASDLDSKSLKGISSLKTDILVVGGGTAGVIAAIQAARAGCSTILVENGSQLGGTITTGGVAFPGLFYAWGKQVIEALIPKNSQNFIAAGRCISSDRLANSALRVQASCMGMGQAAGAAAALASKLKTSPLKVPVNQIKSLIADNSGIVP